MFSKKKLKIISSILPFFMVFTTFFLFSQGPVEAAWPFPDDKKNEAGEKFEASAKAKDIASKVTKLGVVMGVAVGLAAGALLVSGGLFTAAGLTVLAGFTFGGWVVGKLIGQAAFTGDWMGQKISGGLKEGKHEIDSDGLGKSALDEALGGRY
ncbi:hypothetical protein ACFL35_11480 [Candidatus Riflebacteria bacterium]